MKGNGEGDRKKKIIISKIKDFKIKNATMHTILLLLDKIYENGIIFDSQN